MVVSLNEVEMYGWLNKEFNRLTEEIEEVKKQRTTNQQKRNTLMREYHETKIMDTAKKQKIVEETNMLDDKLRILLYKYRAVNEMLEAYYSEKRAL
jgi:predicted  nucleic acid-binding Zn-ribbon protein